MSKGDIVAVVATRSMQHVVAFYAALKIGAVYTAINTDFTVGEMTYVIGHAAPTVLFVDGVSVAAVREALDTLTNKPHVFSIDDGCPDVDSIDALIEGHASGMSTGVEIDDGDLAFMAFTSGTESFPKAITLTHRSFLISTTPAWVIEDYVRSADVFLLLAPMHTMAGMGTVTTLITVGATVAMLEEASPDGVVEAISGEQITVVSQTPTFYRRLVASAAFAHADLSSLRHFHTYGGPIPAPVVEQVHRMAPHVLWATYWGQSELGQLGSIGYFRTIKDVPDQDMRWIGRPVPYLDIRVVDEAGQPAQIGELLCRTPSVMEGYYKNPELTSEVIRDGWVHTGDIVRIDSEGNMYFFDRRKDVIKSGGMNISSLEVEGVISQFPGVSEVAVVGEEDDYWSEVVVAYVVAEDSDGLAPDELIRYCRQHLASFKLPKRVEFLAQLPKDQQGKPLKRELRPARHQDVAGG